MVGDFDASWGRIGTPRPAGRRMTCPDPGRGRGDFVVLQHPQVAPTPAFRAAAARSPRRAAASDEPAAAAQPGAEPAGEQEQPRADEADGDLALLLAGPDARPELLVDVVERPRVGGLEGGAAGG